PARRFGFDPSCPVFVPGIHVLLALPVSGKDVDGTATRACPSCVVLSGASRVNPTCDDKPGTQSLGIPASRGECCVTRGLDPRVHHFSQDVFTQKMDGRVKPGPDTVDLGALFPVHEPDSLH